MKCNTAELNRKGYVDYLLYASSILVVFLQRQNLFKYHSISSVQSLSHV